MMLLAAWAAYCLFGIGVCGFWGRDGRYWPLWCRFMLPGWVSAVSFCSSALLLGGRGVVWVGVWAFGWVDGWVYGFVWVLWVCVDGGGLVAMSL